MPNQTRAIMSATHAYLPKLQHYIDGAWVNASGPSTFEVMNPATNLPLSKLSLATKQDLDKAVASADKAFKVWRKVSAFERGKILKKAADLLRTRAAQIAPILSLEQGKVVAEATVELMGSADIIEWFAEEGRRAYGRIIPSRADGVRNMVIMEPVGVVAGFSPWNFPVSQAARKIGGALAAGCSIIIKCPEETPGSPIEFVKCFHDAGVPPGVINLVYGVPAEISEYLIPNPVIRKISFTGSVPVGKKLNALAALHMKRATMELGGHAPVLIFDDVETDQVAALLHGMKTRNAGQVCVSPTRFFVHEKAYDKFVGKFTDLMQGTKVGDGLDPTSKMGPLANPRRVNAMEQLVNDALEKGAKSSTGGKRIGNQGNFFEPTVLTDVPRNARIMTEEPFGPVAVMMRFKDTDAMLADANSLPFGLASYAFTKDARTATKVADALDAGMVSINHFGIALPETPFGGIKDSGFGHEGGIEGLQAYLSAKFVSQV
jgi:succinate-semialdehyde dehydrogenase / glutarate-semialdehyde dehydrogenase